MLLIWLPHAALAAETMRIAMGEVGAEVLVSAKELSFGADLEEASFTALPDGRATVRRANGRLTVNGAPVVADAVRFRGSAQGDAGTGDSPIKVAEHQVRGEVVVRLRQGTLQWVNVLPLEDYLVGVLGSEMPRSFPDEARKAQAIAARTYALQRKLEAYSQPVHLGSNVLAQVYGGLLAEDSRTRAAVEATRGMVLTFGLSPIEAYFHASCGGRTESGLDALGRDLPYLVPVDCPCSKLPASRWSLTLSAAQLSSSLGLGRGTPTLEVTSRTATGRARRLRVGERPFAGVTFRERLGYTRVKSLAFEIEPGRGDGSLTFTGRGYGHGAGMCQWGAKALADQGWDFRQILEHYYPGTELQALY
jgi:stage II sporulation protein D